MTLLKLSITALATLTITACSQYGTLTKTMDEALAVDEVNAEMSSAMAEKPSISTSRSVQITAKVTAIDHETRIVTLAAEDGKSVTFRAGDEARNLSQVAVGDLVSADYLEHMTIQVIAAENVDPSQAVLEAVGHSEEGATPAMEVIEAQVEVFTVEEINIENNTFKLKNVDGVVTEFTARNPDNLKHAVVGDLVVISLTHAIAISVEKSVVE